MIYMDAAATSKYRNVDDIVVGTITQAMKDSWLNPSSLYATGIKHKIDRCRENIANFINAKPEEIIFTSGSSESNNMAIRGFVDYMRINTLQTVHVITTPIEHKSVLKAVENPVLGARIYHCDVDEFGFVDYKSLEHLLALCEFEPILVSVCMANNEVGTIQNVKEIVDLVHEYDGIVHVDATQALGHIPIDVEELGVDMVSCSGHKISPVLRGIGFLYKRNSINIQPLIYGTQENGLRGGTENTYEILGLSKALEYCDVSQKKIDEMCKKRDYFIGLLESEFGCKLNGSRDKRLPNNVNITFPHNITGESLSYMLDMDGVKCSVGSACNSKEITPSHVLKGINLTDEQAMKTVRFSLPDDITYDEINRVIGEIDNAIQLIGNN